MNLGKIDLSTGELKILYSQPQASAGAALVTAGDLLFWGDQNRRFRAFDAEDGKLLWESVVAGMVMTSTITYAVNGKQYVMVFTGEGQSVSAGPLSLTQKSMPQAVRGHNSVFVFALP
jgi:alcohol dehydrogenase (cytochrome c)